MFHETFVKVLLVEFYLKEGEDLLVFLFVVVCDCRGAPLLAFLLEVLVGFLCLLNLGKL